MQFVALYVKGRCTELGSVCPTAGMQHMQNYLQLQYKYLKPLTPAQTWCFITLLLGDKWVNGYLQLVILTFIQMGSKESWLVSTCCTCNVSHRY